MTSAGSGAPVDGAPSEGAPRDGALHDGAPALAGPAPLGVEVEGEGPPLLLVHGGITGGRLTFGGLVPSLVDAYRVAVVDRPGFERTPGPDDVPVRIQADRLLATIDDLDLAPVHAVGVSFGGLVVLRAVQQRPEAFATLTLVEVPAIDLCPPDMVEPERLVRLLRRAHEDGSSEAIAAVFAEVDPGLWTALSALIRREEPGVTLLHGDLAVWDAGLDRYGLAEAAGALPVLTVSGSTSAPAFRTFGACTAAALAGRHEVIAGAGHAAHLHPAFPPLLAAHTGVAP